MAAPSSSSALLKACEEVIFVTTFGSEDQTGNVSAWDARTGNLLQTFRNGSAAQNTLCMLGGESLLAASHTKPIIHVWNMLRQSQKHRKLICGSKVSCLAMTPDGNYIAAGMEDKIHIWQVCSGELYSVLSYSSVEVKCLKFSPFGQHLVSGYSDGAVAVWELIDVLYNDPTSITEHTPVNVFLGHAGEVTDFHISLSNRVASSSMDFTVRIWNLLCKEQLKMFELGAPITTVALDHSELCLYAGDINGNVYAIDLHYQPSEQSVHIDTREENKGFTHHAAHTAAVRCMKLSVDQSRLITGSDDKTVKVWTMMSAVTPLVITLNERVSNLLVVPTPSALVDPDHNPKRVIGNLKRHLHGTEGEDNCDDIYVEIRSSEHPLPDMHFEELLEGFSLLQDASAPSTDTTKEMESLKLKANQLKKANEEMYEFALKEIIK
ncbi:WD repeat-containing protein 18-like [Physella acuta]|uniref:WD repeat-containing protein 18-like n=1 Tax=Physella acuta TaxID=109671 RepID=UPI0027DE66DB|nr:WD repeat-containing protein 18-like [Physella acuta]